MDDHFERQLLKMGNLDPRGIKMPCVGAQALVIIRVGLTRRYFRSGRNSEQLPSSTRCTSAPVYYVLLPYQKCLKKIRPARDSKEKSTSEIDRRVMSSTFHLKALITEK